MRLRAEHPTGWPSARGWKQWWQHELELDGSTVDADGFIENLGLHETDRVLLTAGRHLGPGALYQVRAPGVSIGAAAAGIDRIAGRRLLRGKYQDHRNGRYADLDLDGLDDVVSIRSTSTLEHLEWKASFVVDRDRLLDAELNLDWLHASVQARVSGSPGAERLVVEATLRGAGIWRPVLAPLLAAGSRSITTAFMTSTRLAAERLATIDQDPTGRYIANADERRTQQAAQIMRERAHLVETAVAARPWWRRRTHTAWMRALTALPPPQWPADVLLIGDWSEREHLLHDRWFTQHRKDQPTDWIGEHLVSDLREVREHAAAQTAAHPPTPPAALTDEILRLDWLRSPWSTIRFMGKLSSDAEAESALRDMLRSDV